MKLNGPLVILGGGVVVAFLWPFHVDPIPSFSGEWVLGMALMVALLAKVTQADGDWVISNGVALLLPVVLVIAIQMGQGRLIYAEQGVFGLFFLGAAILTSLLVRSASAENRVGGFAQANYLFWAVWVAAMLSALTALFQLLGWDRYMEPFVFPMDAVALRGRPTGNIAQPNLLSTLCALGMVAAGWLGLQRRLGSMPAIGSVLFLSFCIGLTGSRTAFLFVPIMVLAAVAYVRSMPNAPTDRVRWVWLMPLSIVVMHFVAPSVTAAVGTRLVSDEIRALDMSSSSRIQLWELGWRAIVDGDWLGQGFGSYIRYMAQHVHELGLKDTGVAHHSHNLVLQVGVDLGWLGLTILCVGLPWYVIRSGMHQSLNADRIAAWAGIGVLLAHSLLEFPLWYLHFWLVFAWLWSIADVRTVRLSAKRVRPIAQALALGGLIIGIWVYQDFWETHRKMLPLFTSNAPAQQDSARQARSTTLFRSYDDYLHHMFGVLELPLNPQDLQRRKSATLRHPFPTAMIRMAVLEVLSGREDLAKSDMQALMAMYPDFAPEAKRQFQEACDAFRSLAVCEFTQSLDLDQSVRPSPQNARSSPPASPSASPR